MNGLPVFKVVLLNSFIFCSSLVSFDLNSQVEFKSNISEGFLKVDDVFTISYTFNVKPDSLRLPAFKEFILIKSDTVDYNLKEQNKIAPYGFKIRFALMPINLGKYEINDAKLYYNTKEYFSGKVNFDVVDDNEFIRRESEQLAEEVKDKVLLEVSASSKKLEKSQSVILKYNIYVHNRYGVKDMKYLKTPKLKEFNVENLSLKTPEIEYTNIDGVKYSKVELLKFKMTPLKKGKIEIEPLEMMVNVEIHKKNSDIRKKRFELKVVSKNIRSDNLIIEII